MLQFGCGFVFMFGCKFVFVAGVLEQRRAQRVRVRERRRQQVQDGLKAASLPVARTGTGFVHGAKVRGKCPETPGSKIIIRRPLHEERAKQR